MHYLDNAATTPVRKEVIDSISKALQEYFANPSSLYLPGYEAESAIEKARTSIAKALGCYKTEIIFTASGSEGNNMAIFGAMQARKNWGKHMVTTGYEHPSVAAPLARLALQQDVQLTVISPDASGRVEIEEIVSAVREDTALVCAMQVNNETGAIINVETLAKRVKEKNPRTAVHVDGVQGFTKLPIVLSKTEIDSYAVSGHKLNAPKGVGALYLRKGYTIEPVMLGGGQEKGLRPGTENTPYIVGLAKAVELAMQEHEMTKQTIETLYSQLQKGLEKIGGITINSPKEQYLGIVNFSVQGLKSETLLHFLEQSKVYVSSGSACGKGSRSHTLTAMKLPVEQIDSALRVSFNGTNTSEDIDALLENLQAGIHSLARKSK